MNGRYSTLAPAGPAADRLAGLGIPILLLFLAIVIVVWALLAALVFRRHGTLEEHAPIDAQGGMGWVLIGGFLLPVLAFAGVFLATLRTMSAFPMEAHHGGRPAEIRILGRQWWWEVQYLGARPDLQVTTANEIHIPVGRPVEIELETRDVIHSFWVPRLHGKVDLVPGQPNRIRIQAGRPGVYPGECAEFCGLQHANMRLLVIAEPPQAFARWLEHERKPALAPRTVSAHRGRVLFMSRACSLCHTVRGTPALGSVGPDLTHLGSRRTIAANTLPNNLADLHAWVTNAPSLKPGVKMPELAQFRGDELHDLVEYLRELR